MTFRRISRGDSSQFLDAKPDRRLAARLQRGLRLGATAHDSNSTGHKEAATKDVKVVAAPSRPSSARPQSAPTPTPMPASTPKLSPPTTSTPVPTPAPSTCARKFRLNLAAKSDAYGKGSYGQVLRGLDAAGHTVAIKCIADGRMRTGALESEVSILHALSKDGGHPNVAKFRAWLPLGSEGVCVESGGELPDACKNCHMVVMEACEGGEMFEHVVLRGGLSERDAAPILRQVCSAVVHAKRRGIAHRDIKLENILLTEAYTADAPDSRPIDVKLIDWGLAHQHSLRSDGSVVPAKLRSRCGSRSYMSPEIATIKKGGGSSAITSADARDGYDGYDGFAADVWSLGVCLFAMLFGFFPFDSSDPSADWRARRVCEAQLRGESTIRTIFGFYESKTCTASEQAVALLDAALLFNPAQRPSVEEMLRCEWLSLFCAGEPTSGGGGGGPTLCLAAPAACDHSSDVRRGAASADPAAAADHAAAAEPAAVYAPPAAERQDSQSTVRSDRSSASASSISSASSTTAPASLTGGGRLPTCSYAVAGGSKPPRQQHEAQLKYAARWRLAAAKRNKGAAVSMQ